jgi:spore germination cell wall hydrolase CwlJ-like protein
MKKLLVILLILVCFGLASCTAATPQPAPQTLERTTITQEPVAEPTAPDPKYEVTPEERLLLAQLVYREANLESLECQKAVASVVFNRLDAGKWGDTLHEVIYYKNAFTPATSGLLEGVEPTDTNFEAVDFVLQNGPTLPTEVRYFRSGHHFSWDNYEGYIVLDNTYFGYFKGWRQGEW